MRLRSPTCVLAAPTFTSPASDWIPAPSVIGQTHRRRRILTSLVTKASVQELKLLLAGTVAGPFLDDANDKVFASLRSVTASAVSVRCGTPPSLSGIIIARADATILTILSRS
jgi:hypothetical protein